jgi:hypothetical protein
MNQPDLTPHLTDEQFACVLSGELQTRELPHLATCVPCRLELDTVGLAIGDFNRLSLEDAQARAALRVRPPARGRLLAWRIAPTLQTAAAAACISVALLFGLHAHGPATPSSERPSAQGAGQSAAAAIAEDNRLMQAIDSALSRSEDASVPLSALAVSEKKTHHSATTELAD